MSRWPKLLTSVRKLKTKEIYSSPLNIEQITEIQVNNLPNFSRFSMTATINTCLDGDKLGPDLMRCTRAIIAIDKRRKIPNRSLHNDPVAALRTRALTVASVTESSGCCSHRN
jgi:hypothetical protein